MIALAIGIATFIENDFGTSSAQALIFRARWFELLLLLFGCTVIKNIYTFRLIQRKHWASFILHTSMIIILLGAAVTRYFGYEGMMHIREGDQSNYFLSAEPYLNCQIIQNSKSYSFYEPLFVSTLGKNTFDQSYQIGSSIYRIRLKEFIPNPIERIESTEDGVPMIKIVIGGTQGREEYFLTYGDKANIKGLNFNFSNDVFPNAINIRANGDSLLWQSTDMAIQTVMATQAVDTIYPSGEYTKMITRALYQLAQGSFVIGEYFPSAKKTLISQSKKMKNESTTGLVLSVSKDADAREVLLTSHKGAEGKKETINFDNSQIVIHHGSRRVLLPFSIYLNDFEMERYPGTNNPSSYASEVTLNDTHAKTTFPYRIFMNNILDYDGYRFFQSSFDPDEAGTYLSVNHDFWGTWISYIGYILLTIGMLWTFFQKGSRFTTLSHRLKDIHASKKSLMTLLVISLTGINLVAQSVQIQSDFSREDAHHIESLVVQDFRGRFKPFHTLSNEILRKIAKRSNLYDLEASQILMSMMLNPSKWEKIPLIHIGTHPEVQRILSTQEKRVAYSSFFTENGTYLLKDYVREAQLTDPKDQNTFHKTIIKLDEKINITHMVFSGSLFKIFPIPEDKNNQWLGPDQWARQEFTSSNTHEGYTVFYSWLQNLSDKPTPHLTQDFVENLTLIQHKISGDIMPSASKIKTEIVLNKLDVFGRLRNIYALLAILFLGFYFYSVFNVHFDITKYTTYCFYILLVFFTFQTMGLAMRWYVSGRAPWSNGYESMIYISWTTVLAGLLFSRKFLGGLAATTVLSSVILLVASMSWLDPEITPLVPVLRSYWLTIHVSLEAGSYGFLMLGAVIGMLNLILMSLTTAQNKDRMLMHIKELTIISEITLLGGLFMVSVGTYLGGVWANESWGRYWGWDAKETWALVTILVYAFILHMRFIPGLQSVYAFNFASLFGFATVIMTYFGVNYYLSGLHSYAAGDPVPIPQEVVVTAIGLAILSVIAFLRYRSIIAISDKK